MNIAEKKKGRTLKKELLALLHQENFQKAIEEIRQLMPRQTVNPLISFFCSSDEIVRWRAIAAIGAVMADLADEHIESARVVMRRLMWSLNDESGGIGWGAPEAMGEIMARHEILAKEYHRVLVSYIREDGNFLEHETLQQGLLWGLGRLAQIRPELVRDAAPFLAPFLQSHDPVHRGLAARLAGAIFSDDLKPLLEMLLHDPAMISIFENGCLTQYVVSDLAKKALKYDLL
jgi:hypothetical protein